MMERSCYCPGTIDRPENRPPTRDYLLTAKKTTAEAITGKSNYYFSWRENERQEKKQSMIEN
jgi:hypothetical protein